MAKQPTANKVISRESCTPPEVNAGNGNIVGNTPGKSPKSSWIQGKWTCFVLWVAKKCGIQLSQRIVTSHLETLKSKFQASHHQLLQNFLSQKSSSLQTPLEDFINSFKELTKYYPSLSISEALKKSSVKLTLDSPEFEPLSEWKAFFASQATFVTRKDSATPENKNKEHQEKFNFLDRLNQELSPLNYGLFDSDPSSSCLSAYGFLLSVVREAVVAKFKKF